MSMMKLEYTIDDIREVEQDAYERGRRDALQEMSSEDCINRAEAIDALDWIPKHKQIGLVEWSIRESDVRGMLRRLPSVVPSRPTGKWIEDGYYDYPYYVCSNCGQECGVQNNGVEIEPLCTKYCPNCGARMESDAE